MVEQQASADEIVAKESALSVEIAPEEDTDEEKKHKQLLDTHAQQGRELKAERLRADRAETKTKQLEAEREESQYEKMNEDEKTEYRRSREILAKETPAKENLKNENALLRAIAQTDDPKIAKALSRLYWNSDEKGKFPDKDSVDSVVAGLTPDEDDEVEPAKTKSLPNVTANRGTRVIESSLEEEVKAAEASVKAKDGKFTYGDLLGLRQRRDALARQAR